MCFFRRFHFPNQGTFCISQHYFAPSFFVEKGTPVQKFPFLTAWQAYACMATSASEESLLRIRGLLTKRRRRCGTLPARHIKCCQPSSVMGFGHKHQRTEGFKCHTDRDMVLRVLSKTRHDQSLFIGSPGPLSATKRKSVLLPQTSCAVLDRLLPSALGRPYLASFSAEVPPRC